MKRSFVFCRCPESRNERSREEKLHTVLFVAGDATRMVKASLLQAGDYTQTEGLRPGSSATARRLEDAASGELGALLLRRHVREIWLLTL